jgi:hypothetical protein
MCRNAFTRRLSELSVAAAIGLLAVLTGVNAQADVLWYDGFAINDADPGNAATYVSGGLHGQDGGTGTFFTGTWVQPDFNPLVGSNQSQVSIPRVDEMGNPVLDDMGNQIIDNFDHADNWGSVGSLTRQAQNLPSTGDKSSDQSINSCCHTARTGRNFASPLSGVDGTIYMSFLANFGDGNPADPHYRAVEFWNGGVGDEFLNLSIGFSSFGNYNDAVNQGDDANPNTQLSVKVKGVREQFGTVQETNHQLAEHLEYADQMGKTHAIVLKLDLSTNDVEIGGPGDTVSVFLNPTPDDIVEPMPSLVVSGVDLNVDRMSSIVLFHFTGAQDGNPGALDELRVGTTWADTAILSVPEPAAVSLAGFAALGLLSTARRRQA